MAKYDITYACGHKDTVNLVGPHDEREKRIKWLETHVCPACYKAQKEQEMMDKAAEYDLPNLSGSEKQIEWAKKIRAKFVLEFDNWMSEKNASAIHTSAITERHKKVFFETLEQETSARFWIDNRDCETYRDVSFVHLTNVKKKKIDKAPEARAAKAEATMIPKVLTHPGAVEITILDSNVHVIYNYDEDFRRIVKREHFYWDHDLGCYIRKCTVFTGSPVDRAAELANALLLAGFSVLCLDDDVRSKAQDASFIPECRRWVKYIKSENKFTIEWYRNDKDFYMDAKSLPGARWSRSAQAVVVPNTSWREIVDFSDINGFQLSPMAQATISALKDAEIQVTPKIKKRPQETDKLKKILTSSKNVLPDLKDD